MEEKKLVPKRRFKGFEGDWYKNKLKNLASFSKGRGYSKNDIKNRGTELLLYGSLYTSYQTIVDKVNVYTKKKPNSVLSNGEEVVVPSSGETKEDIARASAIVKSGIIIGGDLNIIQPTGELNSVFLALEISNGSSQKGLIRRAQGSSVVHLYNDDLKSVVIYYPDLKEQQKIGKFFRVLDDRIANQERKIAKVKALKEAYLSEMFPQEGERVPKRRFQGFEGEWEVINLSSLTNLYVGKSFSNNIKKNGKYIVMDMGSISSDGEKLIHKRTNLKRDILQKNDLVMPKDDIGGGNIIGKTAYIDANNKYVLGDHVFRLRFHEVEGMYMHYMINSPTINRSIKRKVSGSAQLGIGAKNVLSTYVYLPKSIKEQQKIAAFFKNLDDQIEAEEAKLEKLKQMKEAYLEEMFV